MGAEGADQGEGTNDGARRSNPIPETSKLKLLSEVERGRHGIIYRARDSRSGRDVSLRVLPRAWPQELSFLAATRASSLEHPHIARVLEAGWREDLTFVILGEKLDTSIELGAIFARKAVIAIRDAATAVDYAGGRGMPHPGLVPDLLYFTLNDRVLVTGYELPFTPAGSNSYQAPEVRDGGGVDVAANVYSLGAILYALMVGREPDPHSPQPPFQFDSRVPDDLEKLIRNAMHVDPKGRPSPGALAKALTLWLEAPEPLPDPVLQAPERSALSETLLVTGLLAILALWLTWPVPHGNLARASEEEITVQLPEMPPKETITTAVAAPIELPHTVPNPMPMVPVDCPAPKPAQAEAAKTESPLPEPLEKPTTAEPLAASEPDPTPPDLPVPTLVGTVKYVHSHYGVIVALAAPTTVGVGDALEAVREEGRVAVLKVRKLSRPEKLYPNGAAVCEASESVVEQGQIVRRPKP
jgi:hypothetical protein